MQKLTFAILSLALIFVSVSCKKEDPKTEPETNQSPVGTTDQSAVKFEFKNTVENDELVFLKKYLSTKGDTFTVTKLIYYISNVVLTKDDGTVFTEGNSYHLIDHSKNDSKQFNLNNVPVGKYNKISFMLGVDSLRNVSGVQSGDLDPAKLMFWTWTTGYIFFKLEGKSFAAPSPGGLTFHVGGYKGVNRAQRIFTYNLSADGSVQTATGGVPTVEFKVNLAEVFRSPTLIDLSTQNYLMGEGAFAKTLADNYSDMITIKEIHN